jgi:hypothetical protein
MIAMVVRLGIHPETAPVKVEITNETPHHRSAPMSGDLQTVVMVSREKLKVDNSREGFWALTRSAGIGRAGATAAASKI